MDIKDGAVGKTATAPLISLLFSEVPQAQFIMNSPPFCYDVRCLRSRLEEGSERQVMPYSMGFHATWGRST